MQLGVCKGGGGGGGGGGESAISFPTPGGGPEGEVHGSSVIFTCQAPTLA